ncbi:MAG TPA: DUF2892 domain-containing protein [Bacillota bacterium]|nr:DUF2892 domain-containing protein [Bacillota bacterium]
MKKNVGNLDAYLRISGGLSLLGIGVICSSKLVTMLGSMKVAEGVTRYCPLMHLLDVDSLDWRLRLEEAAEIELESN